MERYTINKKRHLIWFGLVIILSTINLSVEAEIPLTKQEIMTQIKDVSQHNGFFHPFLAQGKEFILSDNPVFPNLKIISTEEIQINIEAVTGTLIFNIEPLSTTTAASTLVTISGLEPFWKDKPGPIPLYLHQDGDFKEKFTVDNEGRYTLSLALDAPHHIYILPSKSTIYIVGYPGEVIKLKDRYGAFIYDTIAIRSGSNGVIIDGEGCSIVGPGSGFGIHIYGASGVTIKNCSNIYNWGYGIYSNGSWSCNLINNTINNNWSYGIRLDDASWWYNIRDNTIWNSAIHGISVAPNGKYNTFQNNTIHHSTYGAIMLGVYCYNNDVISNTLYSNYFGIANEFDAYDNKAWYNTIRDNTVGVYLQPWWESPYTWLIGPRPPTNMIVWNNNIYNNSMYNFCAWDNTARELSNFVPERNRWEGNYWGHDTLPGFNVFGVNTLPDSNYPTIKDSYPYLVKNGWPPFGEHPPGEGDDPTKPSGTIVINGTSGTGPIGTRNSNVTVYVVSANDPPTPEGKTYYPIEVRFSNTEAGLDSATWMQVPSTLPAAVYSNWTLSDLTIDSEKTVYAQFRNQNGVKSDIVSDTIIFDTRPLSITDYYPSVPTSDKSPTIYITYDDLSGIDVSSAKMWLNGYPLTVSVTGSQVIYQHPYYPYPPLFPGTYEVKFYAKDNAGNERWFGFNGEWKFTVTNTPPEIVTWGGAVINPPDSVYVNSTPTFEAFVIDRDDDPRWVYFEVFRASNITLIAQSGAVSGGSISNPAVWTWQGFTSATDDTYLWQVYAKDVVNEQSQPIWRSITKDTASPSISNLNPAKNSTTTNRWQTVSASYSDVTSGINTNLSLIQIQVIRDADTVNITGQGTVTPSITQVTWNPTGALTPGKYNVTVTVSDNAGNPPATATWSFTIVNQPPSAPPLPALSPPYNSWVTFNPTFSTIASDPDLDNLQVYFEVGSYNSGWLTAVASGSTVYWSLVPDLPDGIYSWRVQAKDSYGLTGPWSASRTIYKDTVKPSITGATPTGNITSRQPVISAAYSDTLSGIKLSSVKMTLNGSQVAATVSANNVNYNPTLAPGNYNVVVTVQDNADNIQTANWSFTIVNQSPSAPTLNSPANNIWVTSNPTFSTTVSDPDLDTVQAWFEVGSYNSGWLTAVASGSMVYWVRTPDLPDGTSLLWRVQSRDTYGATAWSASRTINKDTVKPSITGATPTGNITNRQPIISVSYSDDRSGINLSSVQIQVIRDADNVNITGQGTITVLAGQVTWSPTAKLAPGKYSITVAVSDIAGNSQTTNWSFTIVNQPPSAPTLNSPANNALVTSNPTFSATVSDPDLDTVQAYFEVGSYNSGWLSVTSGSPVTWSRVPDLPDGTYSWRVQAKDSYGLTGPWSASRTVNKDSVKPSINLATATPPTPTNERRPVISVQYSDDRSGIDTAGVQMTVDGGSVTPQTINASDVSYTPPTDLTYGEHTIIVTVKDNAGNITNAIDGTWKFTVNKPPNPPVLQSPDNNIWVNYDPTLTVQVSDDDVGDSMQVYFEIDGMNSGWIPITPVSNNSMVSWTPSLSNGTYTWKAKARDNHNLEGNWSTKTWTVNKDTSPPTASNITFLPSNIAGSGNGIAVPPGGFTIQIVFNETMNTAYAPTVTYDPVGVIGLQPCTTGGTWSQTTVPNDTYTVKNTNEINAATGDGVAQVSISGGQDLAGNPFAGGTSTFVINIKPFKIENVVSAPAVFNPQYETSTISYVLSEPAQALTLKITDMSDTVVRTLVNSQPINAGINYEVWDGRDDLNALVSDAQYKIQISATSYASEPAAQPGAPIVTVNSALAVFNDTSSVPYPFVPPAPSVTVGFNNLNSPNPPIDIVMSITDMSGAAITNSGIEYYGLGVGASGSKTWDGTDALNFGTGGNPCADGLYYYEITQVGVPPLANPKTGTILLRRDNTAEIVSGPVTVYYNNSAGRNVNVQSVDPATLGPQYNAIVTAEPSVYIMSSVYEVTASGDFTLNPALLVFNYDAGITGDISQTLRLRRWNDAISVWEDVPNQRIDLAGKRIIAQVTSFSLFAIFYGADTTPPVITVTSPQDGQEYYSIADGQPTIIPITYIAEDPVVNEVTSGITYTKVTLNGQVYIGSTIDLSNLLGENTLTIIAIDRSGNFASKTVRFTVVLPAVVTVKPESLHINGGVMTVFVQFPAGYDVAAITDAFCDGARYESMTLEPDGARMAIKFRRANLAEPVDAVFEIRGAFQFNQKSCIFKGTDGNKKVLDGSAPPETTTNTTPDTTVTPVVETSSSSSGSSGSSGENTSPPSQNNKGGKKK